MKWSAHRTGWRPTVAVSRDPFVHRYQFSDAIRAREEAIERNEEAVANPSPALSPNPPTFVTGAQIKGARALLGWRRIDLAAAAGLHRNTVAYCEGQQRMPRTASNGPELCTKHNGLTVSAAQEQVNRWTALDCEPNTETSKVQA